MADTAIEWTDRVWNPTRGCSRVSPGCEHCYAEREARRHDHPGGTYEGLTVLGKHGPRWNGTVRFVPEKLAEPLHWKKPRRIFVNSMSDLFHEGLSNEQIAAVFGVMAACPQHIFQVLTKRPERAVRWFLWISTLTGPRSQSPCDAALGCFSHTERSVSPASAPLLLKAYQHANLSWPLPNVHLGVSCEDQQRADERVPLLRQCPAAVRWVSMEPLLGPIGIARLVPSAHGMRNDRFWVVVGGESGPGARPCDVEWIRSIVHQCKEADVPVFVKQLGANVTNFGTRIRLADRKGGSMAEWPASDIQVRQEAITP
jgi:protein gp37